MSFTTSMLVRATAVVAGGATAVAASPVAAAIGAGVAALGAVSLLTGTARPSTLLRIGEDAITTGAKKTARGAATGAMFVGVGLPHMVAKSTKNAVRSAKIEYSARQVASARKKLAKQLAALQSADAATLAALQHDQELIAARVAELTGTAPPVKVAKPRRAKKASTRAGR